MLNEFLLVSTGVVALAEIGDKTQLLAFILIVVTASVEVRPVQQLAPSAL